MPSLCVRCHTSFPFIILHTVCHRDLRFYRIIDKHKYKTPFEFGVNGSKVKVAVIIRVYGVKLFSIQYLSYFSETSNFIE